MHWSDTQGSMGRTGRLGPQLTDPHSGKPGFKNAPARVVAVQADWRGIIVSRDAIKLPDLHWVRSRIPGGWLTELAGNGALPLAAMLPAGQRSEVTDLARGMQRIAVSGPNGALLAVLYVTRSDTLPERAWIVS